MKTQPYEKVSLDQVLSEIAAQEETPDASTLRVWLQKYPQFRHEIIEFATDWIEMAASGPPEVKQQDINSVVNCTMSRVQQQLVDQDTANAFTDLFIALEAVGVDLTSAEQQLGIDRTILASLSKRLVQPQTIPLKLVESLATLLTCSAAAIRQYLCEPLAQTAAYKARGRLQAEQSTFEYIVEHAELSEEGKIQWRNADLDPVLKRSMHG